MARAPPETSGGVKTVAISVIFSTISITAVGLRFVAARIQHRDFRLHDYLAFAALIFTVGYGVDAIIGVYLGGTGQHVVDIERDPNQGLKTIVAGLKNFFASALVWACATFLCKMSVLFLYLDLFPKPAFRGAVFVMMGFAVAFWVGLILTGFLICRPLSYNWDKMSHGQCGSTTGEEVAFAVVNMIIDGAIVFLPMPVVWRLQMSLKKKIGVSCIFSLGLVICVMNAARIGIVVNADQTDYSYSLVNVAIFSGLEVWFGILTACVPTLRPLFHRLHGSVKDRPHNRSHSNGPYASASDASWELDRVHQKRQKDGLDEGHFERLDDDVLPLRDGLIDPGNTARVDPPEATRRQRLEAQSSGRYDIEPDDIQVRTDISTSSTMGPRV